MHEKGPFSLEEVLAHIKMMLGAVNGLHDAPPVATRSFLALGEVHDVTIDLITRTVRNELDLRPVHFSGVRIDLNHHG